MSEQIYNIEKALAEVLSRVDDNNQNGERKKSWDGLRRFYLSGSGAEVNFIPVFDKNDPGFWKEFLSIPTFRGVSSQSGGYSFEFMVLPKSVYGDLSPEEEALHKEVSGLISELYNLYKEDKKVDAWKEVAYRNFTLMWGVLISAIYPKGAPAINKFDNCRGKACLFIFNRGGRGEVIKSLNNATNSKVLEEKTEDPSKSDKECKEFLYDIMDTGLTNRKGSLKVSCVTKEPTFTFKVGGVPKDLENISEETAKCFDEILPTFLGFNYDREHKRLFNVTTFKELRDHLLLKIEAQKKKTGVFIPEVAPEDHSKVYENKNDLNIPNQSEDEELPF